VADLALARGHQVRVVPAALVKSLGAVSCRIDLPSVHVPSHWSRLTKSQCAMRERVVQARTSLVNSVRAWLRMQLKGFRGGAVKKLPARVRQRCQQDWQNEVCRRLMTVPGVGPNHCPALRRCSRRGEPLQQCAPSRVYIGLTPGEDSSSERKRITGITKAGSSALRWTLVQAAWATLRSRAAASPLRSWALQLAQRRGKRIAVVAVARKLAGILYALLAGWHHLRPRLGGCDGRAVTDICRIKLGGGGDGCPEGLTAPVFETLEVVQTIAASRRTSTPVALTANSRFEAARHFTSLPAIPLPAHRWRGRHSSALDRTATP
jgi:hypothetical protein